MRKDYHMWKMAATAAILGFTALPVTAMANDATGIWRMENGRVTVMVSSCGGNLCGTVVGLKKPRDDKGNPRPEVVVPLSPSSDATSADTKTKSAPSPPDMVDPSAARIVSFPASPEKIPDPSR